MMACYVELLLLVSTFPVVMPQIRNLSPLRGILNTDLPDALRTTTVSTFAAAGAAAGASAGAGPGFGGGFASQSPGTGLRQGVIPFFNIPNAPGALGTSGGTGGGFGSFGGGGGAFSDAAAGSFEASGGFGGGFANNAPSPPRRIIISVDDVEEAFEFAFSQSASGNRFRPQGQTPPAAAFLPSSGFGGAAGGVAGGASSGGKYGPIDHGPQHKY